PGGAGARLLALYDHALPQVYGYLLARCGHRATAEDLTAETFLAAVDAVRAGQGAPVSTAWLVGVARHKLSDHWRRQARGQRARLERALDLPEGVAVSDTRATMQPHPAPVAATRRRGAAETADDAPGGARAPRQGDIGYASLQVPNIARATAFYTAVLGWAYEPSHDPRARQVPVVTPPQGLWGGQPRSTLFCSYVVDDAA